MPQTGSSAFVSISVICVPVSYFETGCSTDRTGIITIHRHIDKSPACMRAVLGPQ